MSLKTFHILFICVSTIFTFGFGAFEIQRYQELETQVDLAFGIGSTIAGIALLVYGVYFLKSTKHIPYL